MKRKTPPEQAKLKGTWVTPQGEFELLKDAVEANNISKSTLRRKAMYGEDGYNFQPDTIGLAREIRAIRADREELLKNDAVRKANLKLERMVTKVTRQISKSYAPKRSTCISTHVDYAKPRRTSKGHKHTAESRAKMSKTKTGKKLTQETKQKMSKSRLGVKNYQFKGFYYTPYGRFASSYEAEKVLKINAKDIYNLCKKTTKWSREKKYDGWSFGIKK